MNLNKLKQAEKAFHEKYPEGFACPEMQAIGKRHKMEQMIAFAQSSFSIQAFKSPEQILDNLTKLVSRSSMISLFEKPKFKDFALSLSRPDQENLVNGLQEFLHGKEQKGFETMLKVLEFGKMAKWSILTAAPSYFEPNNHVFIKPTTAKGVITYFELPNITYHSKPSWDFYKNYRTEINAAKKQVSPDLSPSNAAFCGFLMMSLPTTMII